MAETTDSSSWHRIKLVNEDTHTGICSQCGLVELKRRNPRSPDGPVRWSCMPNERAQRMTYKWECRDQRRETVSKYGLTKDDYQRILAQQNGCCAICRQPPRSDKQLAVDHDHACCDVERRSCGECVRGLLCYRCNFGIGRFDDDPTLLESAAEYLRSH